MEASGAMEASGSNSEPELFPDSPVDSCTQTECVYPLKMVDKSIDHTTRMKSMFTQFRHEHFQSPIEAPFVLLDSDKPILKISSNAFKKSKVRTSESNTEWSFPPHVNVIFNISSTTEYEPESEDELSNTCSDPDDSFHVFDFENNSSDEEVEIEEKETFENFDNVASPILDTKFIVFWSCLLPLLRICRSCFQNAIITKLITRGSALTVSLQCINNHLFQWTSQPKLKTMNAGNVLLGAAILYSGNTYARIKELMNIANIKFFSHTTYVRLQKGLLFPSINKVYKTYRGAILTRVRLQNKVHLLGDGRCDSPGYNAKYGTYTLMEAQTNEIVDFYVVHVSIAGNSARMEKEGLVTLLEKFKTRNIPIKSLTTDRHIQIKAYMKKEQPEIVHQCDVWHVGKNIKKHLVKRSKKKDCEELRGWIKAIINHFWWVCASCNGCVIELKERWLSVIYHIRNKHRWEHNEIFKKCQHPKLTRLKIKETKWLTEGSPAYIALEKIVADRYLLADLKYLTNFCHTGNIEVYHSLYNKYCPKRLHFGYNGMIARSQLAMLDYNAGVNLGQAQTKLGQLRYKQSYSKVINSWCVKKIAAEKPREYIDKLLDITVNLKLSGDVCELPKTKVVPNYIAPIEKPPKQEAIENMRTRFLLSE